MFPSYQMLLTIVFEGKSEILLDRRDATATALDRLLFDNETGKMMADSGAFDPISQNISNSRILGVSTAREESETALPIQGTLWGSEVSGTIAF
jgi:hypothetical protein